MDLNRREAMGLAAGSAALRLQDEKKVVKIGRLKQSACSWCYTSKKISVPELCKAAKEMGLSAIDLLREKEWGIAADHGLVCSMGWGYCDIPKGFNDKANHDKLLKDLERGIQACAKAGNVPNIITFFGNAVKDLSDKEMIDNCVEGLNKLKPIAEANKITVCVELLNSKRDHKGYWGDRTWVAVEVIKAVGSEYVKILYDIYHMQIMEGDVIETIRKNIKHFGHFHTGGVPGRKEINETQELNWRAVAKAIADLGYKGYFAHEFVPTRKDPLESLREAVAICDV